MFKEIEKLVLQTIRGALKLEPIGVNGARHVLVPDGFKAMPIENEVDDIEIEVSSLHQLVTWAEHAKGGGPVLFVVQSHETVELYGQHKKESTKLRTKFGVANAAIPQALNARIDFEKTISLNGTPDQIIVAMSSCYEMTPTLKTLLQVIGSIKEIGEMQVDDTGLSQNLTVKTGVVTLAQTKIENPVMLKPRLTFAEIAAPEIPHIVRINSGKGQTPTVSISSFDTAWQQTIIAEIVKYLNEAIKRNGIVAVVV